MVSVIIPAYNVEDYISESLESVVNQTYRNIEIIVIDDGSTDNTLNICNRYAKNDSRIHVICTDNHGVSQARNEGLKAAKGEYIAFVDSDDYAHSHLFENILKDMCMNNSDIGIADYGRFSEKKDIILDSRIAEKCVLNSVGCIEEAYKSDKHGINFTLWAKVYRRDLFEKNNIRFPINKIHEDIFTLYELMYYATKITYSGEILYFYRKRQGSIMLRPFSLSNLAALEATREAIAFFDKKEEKAILDMVINYHIKLLFCDYYKMIKSNSSEITSDVILKYRKEMKTDILKYLGVSNLPLFKKIAYKIVVFFPILPLVKIVMLK